jgi:1,4-dihydroxy-2-naphthoate octaprenyltransferase
MLFGLIMMESANLFMADWSGYKNAGSLRWEPPPIIEGSPMIREGLLPLRYSVHAAIVCLALAALTFTYFATRLGFVIIALGVLALAIGAFYVLSPVRYGFFSTALLPPIIAFGSYFVLAGGTSWEPVLACIPMMLLSGGVIFTYRMLYHDNERARFQQRKHMLLAIYALAYVALATVALGRLAATSMILGFASMPILIAVARALNLENSDYLPATSLGVLLYSFTGILIAASYALT